MFKSKHYEIKKVKNSYQLIYNKLTNERTLTYSRTTEDFSSMKEAMSKIEELVVETGNKYKTQLSNGAWVLV